MSRQVELATNSYHEGDYNACITQYNSILSGCHQGDKSPRVAFLHSNRCQAWVALGQWENAKMDAERTVMLLPSFVKGHCQVGLCEEQEGHLAEASSAFCTALQHIASIHKSKRQTTSAFLLTKLLRLACDGDGNGKLLAKLDLGLTLAGWDRIELLRWLLRMNDWPAVDRLIKILQEHENITLEVLQQSLVTNSCSENEPKDGGKDDVLAESLSSAMQFALSTGSLIPLQLLLRFSCQAANSKDISDAGNNSLLHQICILHNADSEECLDENKTHVLDPSFLLDWLVSQGLNCGMTNRDGKKPCDLLRDQTVLWKILQPTANTDLIKDLAYMESQEIENFLLSQFCTLRKLNAVDLIDTIPGLSKESIDAIKTATESKRRNTAWRALVQGVQGYAEGLLELALALNECAPVQSKLVLLAYSNRCSRRLWKVCPEILSVYRNWSILMQVKDIKDIVIAMKTLPASLQTHILGMSYSTDDHQRAVSMILMHHLVGENEVKDLVRALDSTGYPKVAEMVEEGASIVKENIPQTSSMIFTSLKESPFTTFEDIPSENVFSKHRRRKTSSRPSRSSRQTDSDLSIPEPLKDFEVELASQVTSCQSAVLYMPLVGSHVPVAAAVVQRHIWSMNDLEEDPKENAQQGAAASNQKVVKRSKSCEAPVRNVALKMVERNEGTASVNSSPRKRKKSGRNMTDDHDEYIVGRHVANIEGPARPRSRDQNRPAPSKSPRRGRHLSDHRQAGGDYSPSPCRDGRRGQKGQGPGSGGGHHGSRQVKSQPISRQAEEESAVEADGSSSYSASDSKDLEKTDNQSSDKVTPSTTASCPKNYSILVQVPQFEDIAEITRSLSLYLPHLNIACHGVNKSAKIGLVRLLDSCDVVVTTIKSTRNCLGAKSLSLADLTLMVTLNLHGNDLEKNLFASFETKGVSSVRNIVIVSELMSPSEDLDSQRRTLDHLNCSHLVFNQQNRLQMYQQINNSLKCLQLDIDSANFLKELDSHFANCYGSQESLLAIILDATEELRGFIASIISSSLPAASNVIDLDSGDLEEDSSKVKVKSSSSCTLVYSNTADNSQKLVSSFPEANFVLIQSGKSVELVFGAKSSDFVSIFQTYASLCCK